jgi:ketosteroid isomerase-like protein
MFPDPKVVVEELIDGGPERVIAVLRVSGTAKAAEFRLNCDLAYTIRGGRVVRGREYMTKEEAGAAVSQGT